AQAERRRLEQVLADQHLAQRRRGLRGGLGGALLRGRDDAAGEGDRRVEQRLLRQRGLRRTGRRGRVWRGRGFPDVLIGHARFPHFLCCAAGTGGTGGTGGTASTAQRATRMIDSATLPPSSRPSHVW